VLLTNLPDAFCLEYAQDSIPVKQNNYKHFCSQLHSIRILNNIYHQYTLVMTEATALFLNSTTANVLTIPSSAVAEKSCQLPQNVQRTAFKKAAISG